MTGGFSFLKGNMEMEWSSRIGKGLFAKWRARDNARIARVLAVGKYVNGALLLGGLAYNLRLWFTVRMPVKRRIYIILYAINWGYCGLGYRVERVLMEARGQEYVKYPSGITKWDKL